jgi:group I intron endonuclease
MTNNSNKGIYKITNVKTNKAYIGSTLNFRKRFSQHKNDLKAGRHGNTHLQSSFNKHGEASFVFEILEDCHNLTAEEIRGREQYYFDQIVDWAEVYNIARVANHILPLPPVTLATKEKFSKKYSGEGNPNFGKKHSEETRSLIAAKRRISGSGVRATKCGTWNATIKDASESLYLGTYKTKEDALRVRLLAEKVLWHEDSSLELEFLEAKSKAVDFNNRKVCGVGVNLHKETGKYAARITVNSKRLSLGLFQTEEEARDIRNKAEKYYYEGDLRFAHLFDNSLKEVNSLVGITKRGKKFRASVSVEGVRTWLGTFDTPEEAKLAREKVLQSLLD